MKEGKKREGKEGRKERDKGRMEREGKKEEE